jgi:hypothetical protein
MAHPLDSAYFKLARAAEHLNEAESEISIFRDTDPQVAFPKYDFDAPEHTLRLRVIGQPPPRLGLLFADALQNIRSALDHLIYQLADLDTDHPRGDRTQYPIYDTPEGFDAQPARFLEGVPREYWTRIREAQPYEPRYRFLGPLRILNDRDKHRVLETLVINVHSAGIEFDPPIRGFRQNTETPSGDNAILGWFRSDTRVNMKMKITYEVAFGIPGGTRMGTEAAKELIRQVADILARFREAFD